MPINTDIEIWRPWDSENHRELGNREHAALGTKEFQF